MPGGVPIGVCMKRLAQLLVIALAMTLSPRLLAAPYTNYLDDVSNAVASAYANVTDAKLKVALGKAVKDLQKPSTSVAGDFKIFINLATHLMPLQATLPPEQSAAIFGVSSNAFASFATYAFAKTEELGMRIAMVTPFQGLRRAASNQWAAAVMSLTASTNTADIRIAMFSVALALNKLVVAEKLTVKAEAKQGFALESVGNMYLTHQSANEGGTNYLSEAVGGQGPYSEPGTPDGDYGNYIYVRTGLSTATLTLDSQKTETLVEVKLRFTTKNQDGSASGTFTGRSSDQGSIKGTFTVSP